MSCAGCLNFVQRAQAWPNRVDDRMVVFREMQGT